MLIHITKIIKYNAISKNCLTPFIKLYGLLGKPIVTEESLIWGCHSIIILKYSGEFLHMSSSEWANFTRVLGEQQ